MGSLGSLRYLESVWVIMWSDAFALPTLGMGGRQRCRQDPMAKGWGMARSRCRVIRGRWGRLISQVDGEHGDSFVGKRGKSRFSCS